MTNRNSLFFLLFLCGCTNLSNFNLYVDTFIASTIGFKNLDVNLETYNQYEFSFIKLRLGKLAPVYLVLAEIDDEVFHWVSNDNISIFTYNGKIVKSIGLESDILVSNFRNHLSCKDCEYLYLTDFLKPSLKSAKTLIKMDYQGQELISYLDDEVEVNIYNEQSDISDINWKYRNQYYTDSLTNRVLFTKQKIHPFLDEFQITFFYK